MRTDGIPGYVTELFRNAIGEEPNLNDTLSSMVRRCFQDLTSDLALGGEPGAKVALQCMANQNWVAFAEFGLTPSAEKPPSAPVMTLLFGLLRSQLQDGAETYTTMMHAMATLNLSGSFNGAVYHMNSLVNLGRHDPYTHCPGVQSHPGLSEC
jgi:hypothetical protein